jgi:ABC-type dipeptide/oligopeptide/nickel transport system permease subunit
MTRNSNRLVWGLFAAVLLLGLLAMSFGAPDFLSTPVPENAYLGPSEAPPFGTDDRGIALLEYAMQGARIAVVPALCSGLVVMFLSTIAGLVRCAGMTWIDGAIQVASELVGSLPRLVVILVVALVLPSSWRTLYPIGLTWALLAAPGAMDEAASTAGRLGGERFVEALRAHGFSGVRIYLVHVVWLNLRSVIVRQGAEVTMHVVFLEIALSYLALRRSEPSFTHADSEFSWATLLYQGYTALLGADLMHSLVLGLGLVALTAGMAQAVRLAARAR